MCVVACLSRDGDQGQARNDGVLEPLHVGKVVGVINADQTRPEEAVRGTYRIAATSLRRCVEARKVRRPIGLRRQQL